MDIETKEKQEYLRINILEKGYNADDFMQYLETLRGDKGLEIENWSKNDLVKAVHEFIKINPMGDNIQIIQNENENKEENKDYNNNENKNENKDYNNNNENNNKDYNKNENDNNNFVIINNYNVDNNNNSNNNQNQNQIQNNKNNNNKCNLFFDQEFIQCKLSEKTDISKKNNIEITISDPKKIEGSFFSKSYVTYLVKTKPYHYEVRRRFSDFEWLRNLLGNIYINCIIPPIYKKTYFTSTVDDNRINKRIGILQKFITEISIHPLLRNSQIFFDFISIKDEKEFYNKKNIYNKLTLPTKVEDIKTLNGEINITVNNENDGFADKIKKISENNEELIKKLTKEYKLLNIQIQEVISKMKNITHIWDELYKIGNQNLEGETILGIYDVMAKLMDDWAKMQEKQINLINKKIREYFRYIRYEYKCIKDYYNIYEGEKNKFIRAQIKLVDTKENLFENEDIDNWGLDPLENPLETQDKLVLLKNKDFAMSKMLPEETKKVNEYRKRYGCYLNSLINEYKQIQDTNKNRHKENITLFIKEMIENLTSFHVSLTNLIAYIDVMKDDAFLNQ